MRQVRETGGSLVSKSAGTSAGESSWGNNGSTCGGLECEVAVRWEAELSGGSTNEGRVSLEERLESLGLGGDEEESECCEGGFHYFNLFQNG